MPNSFPKSDKLCGQPRIAALYAHGKKFTQFPLRFTYDTALANESLSLVKVVIWAPKSLFKPAHTRNRLRRLMREAWRLNQQPLQAICQEKNILLTIAINYIAKDEADFKAVEKATQKGIRKILSAISNQP